MPAFERAVLIVNPVSGQARGLRLGQQLRRALEERNIFCTLRVTGGAGDAQSWARSAAADGFDLIVAIGGDGTVGEVVSGQARTTGKVPIAVAPVGTANVVALALFGRYEPTASRLGGFLAPDDLHYWVTQNSGEIDYT